MTDYQKTMEEIVENGIAQGHIIGANVLMIKDDKEVYFKSHGYADKENGVPMKRDAIFRLYSMTKPVTAAATMILAERGKSTSGTRYPSIFPNLRTARSWRRTADWCRPGAR